MAEMDPVGQGAPEGSPQRVPDGQGLVSHGQLTGVAKLRRRQPLCVNFQQGQVSLGVAAHQQRMVLLPIPGGDRGLGLALDHVGTGNDIAVLGQDNAGTGTAAVVILHGDADHRRLALFVQRLIGQRRKPLAALQLHGHAAAVPVVALQGLARCCPRPHCSSRRRHRCLRPGC